MCLLALYYRVLDDAPVVVGANREEDYARGGEPPVLLDGTVRAIAGLDPAAGGTWFGANARGVLIALTNLRKSRLPPSPRSRGLLVRDLLALPTAKDASDVAAQELGAGRYAGCNVLCADGDHASVVQAGDWLRVRLLPPGLHVLANREVNDESDPRVWHALTWLHQRRFGSSEHCLLTLRELCGQREPEGSPICLRGTTRGTVSSSVVALRSPLTRSTYLHAQGPPDRTPYADCSHLFHEMTEGIV